MTDMIVPELVLLAVDIIARKYITYSVLLLHPDQPHHPLVLASLLERSPCPLYYHCLGPEEPDLSQFLARLAHEVGEQRPGFGYHISQARMAGESERALADALCADLAELIDTDYILMLDDFDLADGAPAIQRFLERLLEAIPDHCHLLISSRTIPPFPWMSLIARNSAAVICGGRLVGGL